LKFSGPRLIYVTILLFILGTVHVYGQAEKQKDSLLFEFKYAEIDDKLAIAKDFSHQLYKYYPEDVLNILDEVLNNRFVASSLDSADVFHFKALASYYANDFDAYYSNKQRSVSIMSRYEGPKCPHYHSILFLHESLEAIHAVIDGHPDKAMRCRLSALSHANKSGDIKSKVKANITLGSHLTNSKIYTDAIKHLKKATTYHLPPSLESKNLELKAYSKLAFVYSQINQVDSSDFYLSKIPSQEYDFDISMISANLLYKKERYFKAISLIDSLLNEKIALAKGPSHWLPYLHLMKGDNLYKLKRHDRAEEMWLKCRLEFLKLEDTDNPAGVSEKLYEHYKREGKFSKALLFHEEYKSISDSILYKDNKIVLEGIYAKNSLSEEKSKNKILLQAELIQEATIQKQKFWTISGFAMAVLSFMLALIYFKSAKKRKDLNKKLKQSNQLLGERNQEVSLRVEELSFISENLPEGVGRLNKNWQITYFNTQFKVLFDPTTVIESSNIFHLLNLSKTDARGHQTALIDSGETSFSWSPASSQKMFQVLINSNAPEGITTEYVMVLQDVTELNNKAGHEMSNALSALSKLEESVHQNGIKKKEMATSLVSMNKELTARMMQEIKRSEEIKAVLENLKSIYNSSGNKTKLKISKTIGQLNRALEQDDYWQTFLTYFQGTHPLFLDTLKSNYPDLSNNEVRHCTFIKLGLSNREVADMLNVSSKTVEVARYRIKKKLNLDRSISLHEFIRTISRQQQPAKLIRS